ncbi:MAG: L,D-transpeptidase [Akkermansiaceae bacterium]
MLFCRLILLGIAASSLSACHFGNRNPDWQVNRKLHKKADATKTTIQVSLYDQKAWLLDAQGRVLVKTNVSTGVPGHETPQGKFKVLERLESKRSNKYGRYVNKQTRKIVVDKSWLHTGPPPEGTEYEGISMPYWMRLTWYGVGMHVGKFPPRTRCSFGCIRVFKEAQPWIYQKTQLGTEVEIVPHSLIREMYPKEKFGIRSYF